MDPEEVPTWPSKKAKNNGGEEREYKKEEEAKIEEEEKVYKKEDAEECDEEELGEEETEGEEEEEEVDGDDDYDEEEEMEGEEEEEDDSDDTFDFKSMSEELKNEIIRYRTTLAEVGPYDIDFIPNYGFVCAICPINLDKSSYSQRRAMESIRFAIDQENKCRDSKLVLDNIVRANYGRAIGFVFYITFEATDSRSGEKAIYRTKVLDDTVNKNITVRVFEKVEKQTSGGCN